MKIVFAVHHFPPRYTAGAELEAYRIAASLRAKGHDVRVVCVERVDAGGSEGVGWEDDTYGGVPVRRLSLNLAAAPDPFRWEYDNVWIGDHLRALLQEERPDVFHLMGGYLISGRAIRVAAELGVPAVVTLMDYWFLCRRITLLRSNGALSTLPVSPRVCARCYGEEFRRYRWLARLGPVADLYWRMQTAGTRHFEARRQFLLESLNQASAIVSRSHFLRSVYVEAGVAPERIAVSRQGRDFPATRPAPARREASSSLLVGYVGQITAHKGVHILLLAARRLAGAPLRVQVYGDLARFQAYAARLRQLAAGDERLVLAGACPPDEMAQVYRGLDVLVVPSVWYENSPNVILEAFAHGVPVVAANLGGMAELVDDGVNGLLFAPGDDASLAAQLQRLLAEPDLLRRLRAGIAPVKTQAQEADELEALYGRLLATNIPEPARQWMAAEQAG